jgi:2-polyprenyl-3-methyl-5-hydroxy-6-metoxy-1,4-benzoquinol methylase
MRNETRKYRARIYATYASAFQGSQPRFGSEDAKRWARPYAYWFRGWLPANRDASILDVACGSGRLLYAFREQGYGAVAGVDLSSEQVELARQISPTVHCADALEFLAAQEQQYDLITALDFVEHLAKDEVLTFFDRCFCALRPGGRLIIQTPNGDSPFVGQIWHDDFTHESCFTPRLLSKLLQQTGFAEPEAREQSPILFGYSIASSIRNIGWTLLRTCYEVSTLIETGAVRSRVLTRVFCISVVKPVAPLEN